MDIPTISLGGVFKEANSGQVVQKPNASANIPVKAPEPKVQKPEVKIDNPAYEAVQRAAEALKNTFAVSDVRFTIFKDIAGDYVTRFTSLRDGSVKYYPQKTLFETVKIRNAHYESMINDQV